jgi:hypothetical protein
MKAEGTDFLLVFTCKYYLKIDNKGVLEMLLRE